MNKIISLLTNSLFIFVGCNAPSVSMPSTTDQNNTIQPPNNSETFKIEGNQTNSQDINVENKDVSIGNSGRQKGNIYVKNGNVKIGGNAVITGSITIENGDLDIGNSTIVEGKVMLTDGEILIGGNSQIRRDIVIVNGDFEAGNSNS